MAWHTALPMAGTREHVPSSHHLGAVRVLLCHRPQAAATGPTSSCDPGVPSPFSDSKVAERAQRDPRGRTHVLAGALPFPSLPMVPTPGPRPLCLPLSLLHKDALGWRSLASQGCGCEGRRV